MCLSHQATVVGYIEDGNEWCLLQQGILFDVVGRHCPLIFEISGLSFARQFFRHEHVVQLSASWALHAHPSISAFVVTDPLESSARCAKGLVGEPSLGAHLVVTHINGRKKMDNWGYNPTYRRYKL